MMQTVGCTKHMATAAKELHSEKGILSYPDKKKGAPLSDSTISMVQLFYSSDEVSRVKPGKKDFISVKRDGLKMHIQKRLVLNNLNELYLFFKQQNPSLKIGFSKFAQLRPKECVLVRHSGTHSVCVCVIHQNVKLLLV
ncbi:hypothetical protein WN55_11420 [Dufourea novaeangliae]|uniref:Uncharacterized protein n=1 Tax=Dufourea novaeangliae TaxID=178035 RepID=A0A154PAX0_DUFNO|nr:hypothetical protein WN55_11420 [Dufourea novaeangliae]